MKRSEVNPFKKNRKEEQKSKKLYKDMFIIESKPKSVLVCKKGVEESKKLYYDSYKIMKEVRTKFYDIKRRRTKEDDIVKNEISKKIVNNNEVTISYFEQIERKIRFYVDSMKKDKHINFTIVIFLKLTDPNNAKKLRYLIEEEKDIFYKEDINLSYYYLYISYGTMNEINISNELIKQFNSL